MTLADPERDVLDWGVLLLLACLPFRNASERDLADVQVTGAYIGPDMAPAPGSSKGQSWDGFDIPAEVFQALAELAAQGVPLPSEVGEVLAQFAEYLSYPDPYGQVEINRGDDYASAIELDPEDRNAFSVDWVEAPVYRDVDLLDDERLRVTLWDHDILNEDDMIGLAVLNNEDIAEARDAQEIHSVWVGDQTEYQLLFIRVEAW